MRVHVGTTLERPPKPGYYAFGLSLVELSPRGPLLKPGTMTRWRAELPSSARLAYVLPKASWTGPRGALRFDDDEGYRWIDRLSAELRPSALVLSTGADVSPSPRDRELLARFAERARKGGAELVWQAGGVWEAETAQRVARELGIVAAWDPLEDPRVSPGTSAYVRLRALGARSRLGEGLLSTVVERVLESGADEASIAIESPVGVKKARAVLALLGAGSAPRDGEDDAAPGDGEDEPAASDDEDDEE